MIKTVPSPGVQEDSVAAPFLTKASPYAGQSLSVAFLTPEMKAAQDLPCQVEETVQPYPYVERLAVLADHAAEPAVLRLQEQLLARFALQESPIV